MYVHIEFIAMQIFINKLQSDKAKDSCYVAAAAAAAAEPLAAVAFMLLMGNKVGLVARTVAQKLQCWRKKATLATNILYCRCCESIKSIR